MIADDRLEATLAELRLTMPPAPEPKGLYRPLVIVGDLAYTAGHLPVTPGGEVVTGRLGDDMDLEAGRHAATLAGLGILATLRKELGSLDRVRRLVKLVGLVACTAEFTQQPAVVNGCSELLAAVFGPEAGVGARTACGAGSLPLGAAVELEAVFHISQAAAEQ